MHPFATCCRSRRLALPPLLAGCLALQSFAAQAVVIDDFEEGDFSHIANISVDPSTTLAGLSTTSVIGGERRVDTVQNGGSGTVNSQLVTSAGDDTMDLLWDAPSTGAFVSGFVRLTYGQTNTLGADLTADGADRFLIDMVDASIGASLSFANLSISLLSGAGTIGQQSGFAQQTFAGSGVYEFAFSTAGFASIDFSDIDRIEVSFGNLGFDGPGSVTMSVASIVTNGVTSTAVPEPATLALLALGLLGARCRRR